MSDDPTTVQMPDTELERLEALSSFSIMGTAPEEAFDRLTALTSRIFDAPISMINFLDDDTQWTKSCVGVEFDSIDREVSFCQHTIEQPNPLVVPDLREDERFAESPLVTGAPGFRFYAGAPIITPTGQRIGSLCFLDSQTRPALDERERKILIDLADLAMDEMQLRREKQLREQEAGARRRIASELEYNTQRLETALDAASMAVWEWNTETDQVHVLTTLPDRYGIASGDETIPLQELYDTVVEDDLSGVREHFDRARQSDSIPPQRFRLRTETGRAAWIEMSGRRRAPASKIYIGAVRDVSVEQRQLEELREAKSNFKHMLDQVPFGVFAIDDGMVVYANDTSMEISGFTQDDLPMDIRSLVAENLRQKLEERLSTVRTDPSGSLELTEYSVERPDGEERFVEATGFGARFDGKPMTITVMRDITEEKQMLARMMQMDRVAAIGTLSAGVGHEINNPLSYIRGNLDYSIRWLEDNCAPPEDPGAAATYADVLDAMREAREGTQRIREITRDLRRIASRPSEAFETYPTDVNAVVESAAKLTHHAIKQRARLVTELNAVSQVYAEPSSLGQAFLNILLNASRSFDSLEDQTDSVVRISTHDADDQVIVEIEDNGCGIPEDELDSVFDAFYTNRPTGEGTGLGLTTARSSIEKMGGHITIDSTLGEGTLVRVCLEKAPESELFEMPARD
ncbi:MAG: ATP-binding protein [Myxococcota bacterium]